MIRFIPHAVVDAALSEIKNLPPKVPDTISLRTAVDQMKSEIQAALDRGYSLENLYAILQQQSDEFAGLNIKTLRYYLRVDQEEDRRRRVTKKLKNRGKGARDFQNAQSIHKKESKPAGNITPARQASMFPIASAMIHDDAQKSPTPTGTQTPRRLRVSLTDDT